MRTRPSLWTVAFVAAGVATGAGAFYLWGPHAGPPRVTSDAPRHDFGVAAPGELVEHTFLVRNDGGETLRISSVATSCGCTRADVSEPVVKPGRSTSVHVEYRLPSSPGTTLQTARLETNDPANPVFALTVQATVEAKLSVEPKPLDFGVVSRESLPAEAVAHILLAPGTPGSPETPGNPATPDEVSASVVESQDAMNLRVASASEPGRLELHVTLPADAPLGPFASRVAVKLRDGPETVFLPVIAQIRGGAYASPASVVLADQGGAGTQTLRLRARSGGLELGDWSLSPSLRDAVDVSIERDGAGAVATVTLRERGGAAEQEENPRGELRVGVKWLEHSSGAASATLRVPILVYRAGDAGAARIVGAGCGPDSPCPDTAR